MFDLLIRGIRVYAPKDLGIVDIAVRNGRIAQVSAGITESSTMVIDGHGLTALPGIIETHAHMLLPISGTCTMNDFYDGTMSSAFGGVTTLIDFADQVRDKLDPLQALEARKKSAERSVCDYSFHVTLTHITDETQKMIPILVEQGVTSFKFYTTYSEGGLYVSPEDMGRAFQAIAGHGCIATVHAELEQPILEATEALISRGETSAAYFPMSKPDFTESDAIKLVIDLAKETRCPVLIRHVSGAEGVRMICSAQKEGLAVFGETCPHYLCFTREVYSGPNGADFIVHPPIRGQSDQDALWDTLAGDAVFTIGTDDCAFYLRQKRISDKFYQVPGGMPGIETRLAVMYQAGVVNGRISMERLARICSTYPAQIYGIYPRKGSIRPGADADLVLLDTSGSHVISASNLHEKSDYTPFEGFKADMEVAYTISRGEILVERGVFKGKEGRGRWLDRSLPYSLNEITNPG